MFITLKSVGFRLLLVGFLLPVSSVFALDAGSPGRNVNVVGPVAPGSEGFKDVGLRQQNEPSCAVNPENPSQVCCGYNDYRGIDIPGLGDAWQGLACSRDGGLSWNSELIPGHKLDADFNLNLGFAADPNLVAAPGGLFFNYIAADRDQIGGLYLQRFAWRNKEDGWPLIRVGGPVLVAKGTSGRFIDKPHMFGFLNDASTDTVTMSWNDEGGAQSRVLPAGNLGLAAAVFTGNDNNDGTKILYYSSDDWGATWNQPTKLTESKGVNSGINLAANGDQVCAVWRRFDDTNETNSIMYACSGDRGKRFEKPKVIADICPFDLVTLNGDEPTPNIVAFRSNAFPVIAADGENFHVFWSDRGYAAASDGSDGCILTEPDPANPDQQRFNESYGRIVRATTSNGGKNWSAPAVLEDAPHGHQFMPAAYGANGEVVVAWMDNRDDITRTQWGIELDIDKQMIVDFWDPDSRLLYRHSVDVRSTKLKKVGGKLSVADSVKVSNYRRGLVNLGAGVKLENLEFNLPNARMFQQGRAPFIGDYTSVTANSYTQDTAAGGRWKNSNSLAQPGSPVFHISWGDNRDIRGNAWGPGNQETFDGFSQASPYSPVADATSDGSFQQEAAPVEQLAPAVGDQQDTSQLSCEARAADDKQDRTRDQNVYSAALYPAVSLRAPGAMKIRNIADNNSGDALLPQRAMPVLVKNNSDSFEYVRLTINRQPGTLASFLQFGDDTEVFVGLWPRSSAVRTVFVSSAEDILPAIDVAASTCGLDKSSCGAVVAQVALNNDPLQVGGDLEQPDFRPGSIYAQELHDPALLNPNLLNPDLLVAMLQNPEIIPILADAGLIDESLRNGAALFNADVLSAALIDLLQLNPEIIDVDSLSIASADGLGLATLLENQSLLNPVIFAGGASPIILSSSLLNPALWDLIALNDAVFDEVRANPSLLLNIEASAGLQALALAYPGILTRAALNALAENSSLLNENLLAVLIGDGQPNIAAPVSNPSLLNIVISNPSILNASVTDAALRDGLNNGALWALVVANPSILNPSLGDELARDPDYLNTLLAADPANPSVLNATVLNFLVANPSILNAELANVLVANPSILNPSILNPSILNPSILNPSILNPSILNPSILNPSILNPSILNPSILNAGLSNPDLVNPDLLNQIVLNPSILNAIIANPSILNPSLLNPSLLNPSILNPSILNPSILNPSILNPSILNPSILNPGLESTDLQYSQVENPDLAGADGQSGEYIDVTWQVKNSGNTTTGYMAQTYIAGPEEDYQGTQLIVSKPYLRQTTQNCIQVLESVNNVVVNIPNPPSGEPIPNPEASNPDAEALASFWLAPNEMANVTLRIFATDPARIANRVGIYINSEACTSGLSSCPVQPFAISARVFDRTAPVFQSTLPEIIPGGEAVGPEGAVVIYAEPTATDEGDGGSVPVTCTLASGATFEVGITGHVCVASDSAGNTATLELLVEVTDSTPPELTVTPPANLLPVEASSPQGALVDFSAWDISAEDIVAGTITPECTRSDGLALDDWFPLGEATTLSCSAEDDWSNAVTSDPLAIQVVDTTAPVLTVPAVTVSAEATGPLGAAVSYTVSASDAATASEAIGVSCVPASGSVFALGVTPVQCTATDGAGLITVASFDVEVKDTSAPVLNLPLAPVLEATGFDGAAVLYSVSATDIVDTAVVVVCNPPAGLFPLGVTEVTCVATDASGNSAGGSFLVTVADNSAPVLTVPGNIVVEAAGPVGTVVEYTVSATDTADPTLAPDCTPASGSVFGIGLTVVNCSVTDDSGNTDTSSFTVSVQDTTLPVLSLPGDISVAATDASGAVVDYVVTASDAASETVDLACSPASGSVFPVGQTTVSCTATDAQGNQASGGFNVSVTADIVWITPIEDPYHASVGPNLNLRWGYGATNDLFDSRGYLATENGKGTQPIEIVYSGASCSDQELLVDLDAGKSSLRYGSGEWQLNWQTGQSLLPDGSGLQPGCYKVRIPRVSGEVDTKTIILD